MALSPAYGLAEGIAGLGRVCMPRTRQLATAVLLQAQGRMSVHELSHLLHASERTIARDRIEIGLAGVALSATRGPGGGYSLVPGTQIDPRQFLRLPRYAEMAPALPRGDQSAPSAEDDEAVELERLRLALRRVAESLPDDYRPGFEAALSGLTFGEPETRPREAAATAAFVTDVRTALWRGKRLRIRYPSQDTETSRVRVVDPYTLMCRQGHWYMTGYCHWRDDVRVFTVERIEEVTILDEALEPPEALHLPGKTE